MSAYMDTPHYRVNKFTAAKTVTAPTHVMGVTVASCCGIDLNLADLQAVVQQAADAEAYAEECRRLLQEAREIVHVFNPFTPLKKRIDNALAKNPNPAGSVRTEPSPASSGTLDVGCTSEDSGPVGLGPHAMRSHAVGLLDYARIARETWTQITAKGASLWGAYDFQSVDLLEGMLRRHFPTTSLSQVPGNGGGRG